MHELGPGPCALCDASCTAEDYCYGCRKHVCQNCCSNLSMPMGTHEPADHAATQDTDEL
jgi:hypothetical protein